MGEKIRLIAQHDHARAAGTLARHWRGEDRLRPLPERMWEAFFYAVDNHDVGWCEPDASPRLDPETKAPCSFFGVTPEDAVEIWTKGVEACQEFHPFSGVLVSLHFSALADAGLRGAPSGAREPLQVFLRHEGERREALGSRLAPGEKAAREEAVLLLRTCDTISLLACGAPEISPPGGQVHPLARSGLRLRLRPPEGLEIDPWPFDGDTLDLRLPGFTIPNAKYETEEDLAEALEASEPDVYAVRIAPLRDGGGERA